MTPKLALRQLLKSQIWRRQCLATKFICLQFQDVDRRLLPQKQLKAPLPTMNHGSTNPQSWLVRNKRYKRSPRSSKLQKHQSCLLNQLQVLATVHDRGSHVFSAEGTPRETLCRSRKPRLNCPEHHGLARHLPLGWRPLAAFLLWPCCFGS